MRATGTRFLIRGAGRQVPATLVSVEPRPVVSGPPPVVRSDWRCRRRVGVSDVVVVLVGRLRDPGRDSRRNGCPVRSECLADAVAVETEPVGIRGGLTARERSAR